MKYYPFIILSSIFCACYSIIHAQDNPHGFRDLKINPHTPLRDQQNSGTCWAFSAITFMESELLKNGKGEHTLSEMWLVRHNYYEKAVHYVRMHGNMSFSEGSVAGDALRLYGKYGMVPRDAYKGLEYADEHNHDEMLFALKAYLEQIVKKPNKTLTTAWLKGVEGILDAYFGVRPQTFTYRGKEYTPQSFARMLELDAEEYVSFSSFTHHPFYTSFMLEVPDNWSSSTVYNVPMEDLIRLVDASLQAEHNLVWQTDVSEKGFKWRKGFAVVPAAKVDEICDVDRKQWSGIKQTTLDSLTKKIESLVPEKTVTQQMRQTDFDNYETTDDHAMEIIGVATGPNGKTFYKVKNTWGTDDTLYEGYFYTSAAYIMFKTTSINVNRKTIPKDIAVKIGISQNK